jgi:pseudouridine-5'-phosphate glycosidase
VRPDLAGLLEVAPRVAAVLARGGAVVALETTIVTHGMPYPQNVETALAVEAIVRASGAEPATIAAPICPSPWPPLPPARPPWRPR